MKRILIVGGGGLAREVFFHLGVGVDEVCFYDDTTSEDYLSLSNEQKAPILHKPPEVGDVCGFYIGVGNPQVKRVLVEKMINAGLSPLPTFVHSRALVQDKSTRIGFGGIVCPGVIVTTNVTLGDYVILNIGCTVGHDSVIGNLCTVNPNASISGNVLLNEGTLVGTCAAVLEKRSLAAWSTVGAGAVVTKNFQQRVTLVGVPAQPLIKGAI